jgi:uncharacterized protein, YhcH/YjgK/YiaL family
MVVDSIKNAGLYYNLSKGIEKGLKYLQETDFSKMEPGRYEIDGSNVYALVQHYQTKPMSEGIYEAHRKYIDIQYMSDGIEKIGYALISTLEGNEYNSEKDFQLLDGNGSMFLCKSGTFAILMPEDAHMPCIAAEKQIPVKKVVVKVKV